MVRWSSPLGSLGRLTRVLVAAGALLALLTGGVVSAPHHHTSDEGKANQYYLRGFNLDHGTDFATTVAGVPMNMPSHAHGQGYTDLNTVIPELIAGAEYRKGTYSAEDGDFSSAGSAHIAYRNVLPAPTVSVTTGDEGYRRVFAGDSPGRVRAACWPRSSSSRTTARGSIPTTIARPTDSRATALEPRSTA